MQSIENSIVVFSWGKNILYNNFYHVFLDMYVPQSILMKFVGFINELLNFSPTKNQHVSYPFADIISVAIVPTCMFLIDGRSGWHPVTSHTSPVLYSSLNWEPERIVSAWVSTLHLPLN